MLTSTHVVVAYKIQCYPSCYSTLVSFTLGSDFIRALCIPPCSLSPSRDYLFHPRTGFLHSGFPAGYAMSLCCFSCLPKLVAICADAAVSTCHLLYRAACVMLYFLTGCVELMSGQMTRRSKLVREGKVRGLRSERVGLAPEWKGTKEGGRHDIFQDHEQVRVQK